MSELHYSVWGPSTDDPGSAPEVIGSFAAVGTVLVSLWSADHRAGGRMHTDAQRFDSPAAAAAAALADARAYAESACRDAATRFAAVPAEQRAGLFRLRVAEPDRRPPAP